jgi:hypothetical protein
MLKYCNSTTLALFNWNRSPAAWWYIVAPNLPDLKDEESTRNQAVSSRSGDDVYEIWEKK